MKSKCEYTRTHLPRYLAGYLFKLQKMRVDRHLAKCPVCASEFDALRRIRETRRFLRDLQHTGRVTNAMRSLGATLARLFYRPLWVVIIVISVTVLYLRVITPILHDPDLEMLDAGTSPPAMEPVMALQTEITATPAPRPEPVRKTTPTAEPLVVAITVDQSRETDSMKRINAAMMQHTLLRTMQFSDSIREVAGNLTSEELGVLFDRIGDAAKVTYKRSRLKSAADGELIPVVLKFQVAARTQQQEKAQPPVRTMKQSPQKQPEDLKQQTSDIPAENPAEKTPQRASEQNPAPSQAAH